MDIGINYTSTIKYTDVSDDQNIDDFIVTNCFV